MLKIISTFEYGVGYCQGLNWIGGSLLVTVGEKVFLFLFLISLNCYLQLGCVVFAYLFAYYGLDLLFCDGVPLLKFFVTNFEALLERNVPELAAHFVFSLHLFFYMFIRKLTIRS